MQFKLEDSVPHGAVIKVVGVGGGGGNAVDHMVRSNVEGVDFICANTDAQALRNSSAKTVIQLGSQVTKGLGVRVGADEIHAFHVGTHHMIDGVATTATDAHYFDHRAMGYGIFEFELHG